MIGNNSAVRVLQSDALGARLLITRPQRIIPTNFRPYSDMPTAAISPDGSRTAIASGDTLRVLTLPPSN
jgi:hypothetical protein